MTADRSPIFCDRCSTELHPGRGEFYVVRIEAVADPTPPVIDASDLLEDVGPEIERLIEQMRDLTEQEAMDQVYRRVVLSLCIPCYNRWIENPTGS